MARRLGPTLFGLGSLLALTLPPATGAQQGAPTTAVARRRASGHAQDERAIRQVIADNTTHWNRHDAAGTAAMMTEDADVVVPPGTYTHGRAALEADMQALFTSVFKAAHDSVTTERIRFLRPDVAVVDGAFAITGSTLPERPVGLQTAVLVKDDGRWKVAAMRRMIPVGAPPGAAAPGGSAATAPGGSAATAGGASRP